MKVVRGAIWAMLALLVVGSVGLALTRGRSAATSAKGSSSDQVSALVGKPLPSLNLVDLDGKAVNFDGFRGRPVLMNYWATWCIPCRAEMPDIQHAANSFGNSVAIVGVDDAEDAPTIMAFLPEIGVTYPIWRDPTGKVETILHAPGLPYTIFIDRRGKVERVRLGQMTRQYIDDRLREMVKQS
ncbi:MAG: TlpA family protein disulfide reductase [Candidatus Dormibacteria bacterium]